MVPYFDPNWEGQMGERAERLTPTARLLFCLVCCNKLNEHFAAAYSQFPEEVRVADEGLDLLWRHAKGEVTGGQDAGSGARDRARLLIDAVEQFPYHEEDDGFVQGNALNIEGALRFQSCLQAAAECVVTADIELVVRCAGWVFDTLEEHINICTYPSSAYFWFFQWCKPGQSVTVPQTDDATVTNSPLVQAELQNQVMLFDFLEREDLSSDDVDRLRSLSLSLGINLAERDLLRLRPADSKPYE
jgi:hypothetical protein